MGRAAPVNGRWRPLPDSVPAEVACLVDLLRDWKDRSGLSLVALAGRTSYSKSSWERYVNGRTLPPRDAVLALAALVGEPAARSLALWERAQVAWHRPVVTDPQPEPGARHWRRRDLVIAVIAACIAVAAAGALLDRAVSVLFAPEPVPPVVYPVGCQGMRCDGRDPAGMGCDVGAGPSAQLRTGPAIVELTISEQCRAGWARVSGAAAGDRVEVMDQDGRTESAAVAGRASAFVVHSPMIAADRHAVVRACLLPSSGPRRCTPWGPVAAPTSWSAAEFPSGPARARKGIPLSGKRSRAASRESRWRSS